MVSNGAGHGPSDDAGSAGPVDVAVIGYGPVGQLLALLLGRAGHRVIVVERQERAYPLPRAVHFDDEIGRILQGIGMAPDTLPGVVEPYDDFYEWRAADGAPLLRLDWRGRGPSGWHVSNFFHQPGIEARLHSAVAELDTVEIRRGWKAVDHLDDGSAVTLTVRPATATGRGDDEVLRARWVIGADGANSVVRSWIGSTATDLGYFHDWLVVDLSACAESALAHFSPPAWQLCDPARPTTLVPGGPGRRRFEFMRLDHESRDELAAEQTAWRLLEPWGITRDNSVLDRHAVYTFQARWYDEWRKGRLLIAGDAAHLMPPFAGQGMGSGLRDAVNLAWKLDLVLRGRAPDSLLDTYGQERAEHVRHFITGSMDLGAVICLSDAMAAADRDRRMQADLRAGVEQPPRPLPRLGPGLHRDDSGGGTPAIQGLVSDGVVEGLFDDVVGAGPVLLLGPSVASAEPAARTTAVLTGWGVRTVRLGDTAAPGTVFDLTGAYAAWFTTLDAVAVLVRPDHYVFGVATSLDDVAGLVDDYVGALSGTAVSSAG
jgi:3-(3-hydroxy-phenyl)propionate hydroxylase